MAGDEGFEEGVAAALCMNFIVSSLEDMVLVGVGVAILHQDYVSLGREHYLYEICV